LNLQVGAVGERLLLLVVRWLAAAVFVPVHSIKDQVQALSQKSVFFSFD
jgi:hypothetical protein